MEDQIGSDSAGRKYRGTDAQTHRGTEGKKTEGHKLRHT